MTLSNILSVVALLLSVLLIGWIKVITARAFKSIDDKLKEVGETVIGLAEEVRKVEKDIIKLKSFETNVEKDIQSVEKDVKHVKADIVREVQVMNNHLESAHKKIDHVDSILEKLRDTRR